MASWRWIVAPSAISPACVLALRGPAPELLLLSRPLDLIDDAVEVVYPSHSLEQGATVHAYRAVLRCVVAVVAAQGENVAVKSRPTTFASLSISGLPELPPVVSFVVDRFMGSDRLSDDFARSQLPAACTDRLRLPRSNRPPMLV